MVHIWYKYVTHSEHTMVQICKEGTRWFSPSENPMKILSLLKTNPFTRYNPMKTVDLYLPGQSKREIGVITPQVSSPRSPWGAPSPGFAYRLRVAKGCTVSMEHYGSESIIVKFMSLGYIHHSQKWVLQVAIRYQLVWSFKLVSLSVGHLLALILATLTNHEVRISTYHRPTYVVSNHSN